MKLFNVILREVRDYVECFIIPSIAVVLPWQFTFRLFHLFSYMPFLYRLRTKGCVEGARYLGVLGDDEQQWRRYCKLSIMVDFADAFLLWTRGNRYCEKHIEENITEQLKQQQILFFPHYGTGAWAYRLLFNHKNDIYALGEAIPKSLTAESLYLRFRVWVLKRHRSTHILANDMSGVRAALRKQGTILVSPDMPKTDGIASFQISTELGELNVLSGFFRLAESRKIPVMCAVLSLDLVTGKRQFNAVTMTDKTAREYAELFTELTMKAIFERPYLWRMLMLAPQVMLRDRENLN